MNGNVESGSAPVSETPEVPVTPETPVEESQVTPETPASTPPETPSGNSLEIPEPEQGGSELTDQDIAEMTQEVLSNNGDLTDETYARLEGMGHNRELVRGYIKGQLAERQAAIQQVETSAGGAEAVQSALKWASQNLSEAERTTLNHDLQTSSINGQIAIIKDLQARSGAGRVGTALGGSSGISGGEAPYRSLAELHADQAKPEYVSDPAFREKVFNRLKFSKLV